MTVDFVIVEQDHPRRREAVAFAGLVESLRPPSADWAITPAPPCRATARPAMTPRAIERRRGLLERFGIDPFTGRGAPS